MTTKDEELQNQIEKMGSTSESLDATAYKKVFETLRQEPNFHLPTNFADHVISKIESKRESSKDFIWFGIGLFTFAVATLVATILTNFKISFGALKFVTGYPGLFVFGTGFILVLHWLDKKLVRPNGSF